MTTLIDRIARRNPLLAHGPRTHSTGIVLDVPAPAQRRRPRRDVDAPRIHLGPAGRLAA